MYKKLLFVAAHCNSFDSKEDVYDIIISLVIKKTKLFSVIPCNNLKKNQCKKKFMYKLK